MLDRSISEARAELVEAAARAIMKTYGAGNSDEDWTPEGEAALDAILAHPEVLRAASPPSEPSAVEVEAVARALFGARNRGDYDQQAPGNRRWWERVAATAIAALDALRGGAT